MLKLLSTLLLIITVSFAGNGIEIIKSSPDELVLSFNPVLKGFDKVETDDKNISYLPNFEGALPKGDTPGEPYYFVVPALISVPSKDGYSIELVSSPEYQTVNNLLAPVPTETFHNGTQIDYITSSNYFEVDNPPFISSKFLGSSSGKQILKLELLAAHFNSDIQKTAITERVLIRIKFDPSKSTTNIRRETRNVTLNDEVASIWQIPANFKKTTPNRLQNLSSGNWVKVKVAEEGMYRITNDNLKSLGFDLSPSEVESIKIFGYGGVPMSEEVVNDDWQEMPENEIIVKKQGDGKLSEIIFYGNDVEGFKPNQRGAEGFVNWYANDNYYMLTWGGDNGKRASYASFDGQIVNNPSIYKHHTIFSEEILNLDGTGSGRQMVGNIINPSDKYEQRLHDLDRSGEITYRVALAHKSGLIADATINESGTEVGTIRLDSVDPSRYDYADRPSRYFTSPASSIQGDKSSVSIDYIGSNTSSPYLDYIEIHYPRPFRAIDNSLSFFSDYKLEGGTEFNLNGFSGEVYALDVTNSKSPVFLNNYGSNSNPTIKFDANEVKKFYISGKIKSPTLEIAEFSNFRENHLNTDVIVITHKDLLNSANEFKEYREANSNLSVSVVRIDHIYNEFGAGTPDITSIRNFLQYSYNNWTNPPKYVLFWGDAHSDNRNISVKEKVYVPLYHSVDSLRDLSHTATTAHDDYFLRLDGDDDVIELISGRIPLHDYNGISADQHGINYVDKIRKYENESDAGSWRTNISLIADDGLQNNGSNDGDAHTFASESLSSLDVMNNFVHNKVYLIEYQAEFNSNGNRRMPSANSEIIESINQGGSLVLNWSGHGNPYVWAHENVFNQAESLNQLNNEGKLFFATAATCSFGQFDTYDGTIAAEEMLLMKDVGAIGLFAATRLVYANANDLMNREYFENLLEKDPTSGQYPSIGEALFQVKQVLNRPNDEKYLIMGDPTLKLLIPDYSVVIDSFPQTDLPDNPDSPIVLKGLSEVKVMGHIDKPSGGLASDFDGDVEFSVFDGDRSFVINQLNEDYFFKKYGGILNKSSTKVEDGKFEITFILPKDISFSDNLGRMFAFGRSSDSTRFAKGNFNDFRVFGIDTNSFDDSDGPQISLYLDSRKFVEGDVVSSSPLLIVDLFDSLGINSTGVGIGHRIEAWVNESNNPLDMTNNYSAINGSNREGTTNIQLTNVKPGLNKVTVRAWDIFNNFETAETYFYISEVDNRIYITDIINYPNPFQERTTIQCKHNLDPGFEYSINIYDIEGRLVNKFSGKSFDRQVLEVDWDGTSMDGRPILNGSYLIQINLRNVDGHERNGAGIISVKVN